MFCAEKYGSEIITLSAPTQNSSQAISPALEGRMKWILTHSIQEDNFKYVDIEEAKKFFTLWATKVGKKLKLAITNAVPRDQHVVVLNFYYPDVNASSLYQDYQLKRLKKVINLFDEDTHICACEDIASAVKAYHDLFKPITHNVTLRSVPCIHDATRDSLGGCLHDWLRQMNLTRITPAMQTRNGICIVFHASNFSFLRL